MQQTTDKVSNDIIAKVKNGDKKAFEEIYDNYSPAIYGIVSKIVRSEEIGNDLLQETFIKIWRNIHSFNPKKGRFFTWILNIARNTAIDRLRKLQKENKIEIQALDYNVDKIDGYKTGINENSIGLKELINKLSPEQKLVVEYIYFNGYTHKELSDELGIPLGTVKTRVRNAVRSLRKVFNNLLFWM